MTCVVKENCQHKWECDFCNEYSDYQPTDKSIKSPGHMDRLLDKKSKKKKLKDSEASKRGKRNRNTGRRSEGYMLNKYIKWNVPAEKQPGSGKYKGKWGSDLRVTLLGKERLHEDKTRIGIAGKFNKVKDHAILYEDFCIMMNEIDFELLVCTGKIPKYTVLPDKSNKGVHGFFDQDNCSIVSMRLPGNRECVYAVRLNLLKEYEEA